MELLRPDLQGEAALTLAEAFANDPLLQIVAPDPVRRPKGQADCFGHTLMGMVRKSR